MGVPHAAQESLDNARRGGAHIPPADQEKIASSDIEVPHRDVLIRLRSIIEEDLEAEFERSVGSCQEDQPAS